uniref:THAP-type domain-containing protein n=1 Tax=Magallana gigas TaxID=29159 RepID=A0A8W8IAC1_MAGGI
MVIQCVVFKCSNRQGSKAKEKDVSFFRFPKDRKKRLAWIRAINRDDWTPNEYSRVCSEHFVDSRHSDDPTDINYRTTLFAYKSQQPSESQTARNERLSKRNLLQSTENTFISNPDLPVDDVNIKILKDEGMQCDPDPLLVENMALKKELGGRAPKRGDSA